MTEVLKHLIERPITSGSIYRVPNTAYIAWRLKSYNESLVVRAYQAEWDVPEGDKLPSLVSKASERAFESDYASLIRQATAEAVAEIMSLKLTKREIKGRMRFVEIGAGTGASTLVIHSLLPDQIKDDVTFILIDPSRNSLEVAEKEMRKNNVKSEIVVGSDNEVLPTLETGSADLVVGVASIHHHSKIPFDLYASILKEGGSAVFGDWHQRMWTHPSYVYGMLEQLDFSDKEKKLAGFLKAFPQAAPEFRILPSKKEDRTAMRQIVNFWRAMADISQQQGLDGTPLWFLEGHRDVREYIKEMNQVGLNTRYPHQVLPDSSLLQVTVGQKVA